MEFTERELKQEVWKDCLGYEGTYQVSDLGRVRSITRLLSNNRSIAGCIMKQQLDRYGYMYVAFSNKKYKIHRLVAINFIPNIENKPTVNHKDEVKENNKKSNLEWFTVDEQNKHSKGIPINVTLNGVLKTFSSLREASNFLKLDRCKVKSLYT